MRRSWHRLTGDGSESMGQETGTKQQQQQRQRQREKRVHCNIKQKRKRATIITIANVICASRTLHDHRAIVRCWRLEIDS